MRSAFLLSILLAAPAFSVEPTARGRYYYGAEVESFHPCSSKSAYWVDGEESVLKPLRGRADKLRSAGKPYPPIYVEFVGRVNSKVKREGFAEDYDALFEVKKVVKASSVVPKQCAMRSNRTLERDAPQAARPSP